MSRRKTWFRRLRRLLTGLVVLGLLALAGGNALLNTGWAKGKLGKRIEGIGRGEKTHIGRVWWLPLAGLHLNDIRFGEKDDPTSTRVHSCVIHPSWPTVFSRRVEFARVIIDQPEFFLSPDRFLAANTAGPPGGETLLPAPPQLVPLSVPQEVPPVNPSNSVDPPVSPPASASGETATPPKESEPPTQIEVRPAIPESGSPPPPPRPKTIPPSPNKNDTKSGRVPRQYFIQNMEIRRGRLVIAEKSGMLGETAIEDLELNVHWKSLSEGNGNFRIGSMTMGERDIATDIESPVEIKNNALGLTKITGFLGGGPLTGAALADFRYQGSPFHAQLAWSGADIAKILPPAAGDAPAEIVAGQSNVRLDLRGFISQPTMAAIQCVAELQNAAIEFDSGFDRLATVVNIDEDGRALLDECRCIISGANGQFIVQDALVSSGRMLGRARGYAVKDGKFLLRARLYVDKLTSEGIHVLSGDSATPIRFNSLFGTDWVYHEFHLAGSVGEPLADFIQPGTFMPFPEIVRRLGNEAKPGAFSSPSPIQPEP